MITLYTFGPTGGLPDASPFVMKAMMLLKLARLEYREQRSDIRGAPKGKLPYINDNGTIVADSTFIRWHIEKTRNIDFDAHLTAQQRAIGWAMEKLLEDHLYWLAVHDRWLNEENFRRGPANFFKRVPAPFRPLVKFMVRRSVASALQGQGLGRHSDAERAQLARRAVDAVATILGDTPHLFGDKPSGFDATLSAFIATGLWKNCESQVRTEIEGRPNLVAYRDRMMSEYFPSYL